MAAARSDALRLLCLLTCLLLVVIAGALPSPAKAAGFVVNSLTDASDAIPGDGTCATAGADPVCTLRAAVEEANATTDADAITFSVSGRITFTSVMTDVLEPLTIDASTAPGASCATGTQSVIVDGGGASPGLLPIFAPNSTVRGLSLVNADFGIGIYANNVKVSCNRIGEEPNGSSNPLRQWAIFVADDSAGVGSNATIGGSSPSDGNRIRNNGNNARVVWVNANGFTIQNNTITSNKGIALSLEGVNTGTVSSNAIGSVGAGNTVSGLRLRNATNISIINNTIRGNGSDGITIVEGTNTSNTISGNTISDNGRHGVFVDLATSLQNQISENAISGHTSGRGIALTAARVANDPGDTDVGPNGLQNYPVFTSAYINGSGVLDIELDVAASGFAAGNYAIEVFEAVGAEGARFLGTATVASSATSFSLSGVSGLSAGESIVATATDSSGNTSEFSAAQVVARGPEITVSAGGANLSDGGTLSLGSTVSPNAKSAVVTITNDGNEALTLGTPALANTTGAAFSLDTTGFAPSLDPAASTSFTLTMTGTTVGSFAANVSLSTNDADENPFNFSVTGSVTSAPSPTISLSVGGSTVTSGQTTPVDFGTTTPGSPISRTFTVSNAGTANLTLSNLSLPAGYALVGALPTSIAPGDSADFAVRLEAAATGTFTGTLQFSTNVGGEGSFSFPVTGEVREYLYLPLVVR